MPLKPSSRKWVVYVSTFPPRECGIATFTQDLADSFDEAYKPHQEAKIVAMNLDEVSRYNYDKKRVIFQIPQPDEESYSKAAAYLNSLPQVELVNVQHEFGIFGGNYGRHLIIFLRELKKPVVITFHTVLPTPNPDLYDTVSAINNHVRSIIVMTRTSKDILVKEYHIDPEKIVVIPHGIHPTLYTESLKAKRELGHGKHVTISTFGLLSRGKGIEYGIEAMAQVVKKFPQAVYMIIGATHPVVLKNEGEVYRNSLIAEIRQLKLEKNVFFYNKYLELGELLRFLDATDIYLALSQDPNQAVSGTLSYALGNGRAVVSTSFAQAREDVTKDVGILVGFKDPAEIALAIETLVADPEKRRAMGETAYFRTRSRTWRNVVLAYMNEYARIAPSLGEIQKNLPRVMLDHIIKLTDDFGMIQFAHLTDPDPASGYTTDDNSRALIALVTYHERSGKHKVLSLINTYIQFLAFVEQKDGGFHNYVNVSKEIHHDQHTRENLETTSARALFALARTTASTKLSDELRSQAEAVYLRHEHIIEKVTSPRSIAYALKALAVRQTANPSAETVSVVTRLADRLMAMFESSSSQDWKWFEDIMAYSNAVLPDALVDAYNVTKNEKYLSVARQALDFLVAYSFEDDICVPIGQNGWLQRGKQKQRYDQQPEEAAMLVFTLKSMFRITGEEKYDKLRRQAFNWFLGKNSLGQVVYDQATGGCYDGVGEKEINLNQGAESTVMYLLARLSFE